MTKIIIEKQKLLYIARFINTKNDCRIYLQGVYFENDCTITATNGKHLGSLKNAFNKDGDFDNFILPLNKDQLQLLKKDKDSNITIELLSNNLVTLKSGVISFTVELIDSPYPDYKRCIPENKESNKLHFVGINPASLALFAGYDKQNENVKIIFGEDDKSPILVYNPELKDDFIGVITSSRID